MAERAKNMMKTVNSFAARQGYKIVKYKPSVHDDLLQKENITGGGGWSANRVSDHYMQSTMDVYRRRDKDYDIMIPGDRDSLRIKRLQIYLVMGVSDRADRSTIHPLKPHGIIAWGEFNESEYTFTGKQLFKNIKQLKSDRIQELVGIKKKKFTSRHRISRSLDAIEVLLGDITIDWEISENNFDPIKDMTCNLRFMCSNPESRKGGVGRIMLGYMMAVLARPSNRYEHIIVEMAESSTTNKISKSQTALLSGINLKTISATITDERYGINKQALEDQFDDVKLHFMGGPICDIMPNILTKIIDLNIGSRSTGRVSAPTGSVNELDTISCSRKSLVDLGIAYAPNGSRYVSSVDHAVEYARKCGANKGWTNPYAGNYYRGMRDEGEGRSDDDGDGLDDEGDGVGR